MINQELQTNLRSLKENRLININLLHGDCLELMKSIPDKSIDLVLTDPPYGTTACKWDTVIPFEPMWKELKRIRRDNAAIALFGGEPFSSALRMSNIKEFKYDWIWEKQNFVNALMAKKQPLKIHELVNLFYKQQAKYYPQGILKCNKVTKQGRKCSDIFGQNITRKESYFQEFTNYPTSILIHSKGGNNVHPTQKPVALLEYLIKTYTLEGETVLDFTMGSGSTGVACKNLNRNFIGIEKDDKYFEIAKNRINEA
jgi:site-specific DNA-methyltransferase (adenine-specific)